MPTITLKNLALRELLSCHSVHPRASSLRLLCGFLRMRRVMIPPTLAEEFSVRRPILGLIAANHLDMRRPILTLLLWMCCLILGDRSTTDLGVRSVRCRRLRVIPRLILEIPAMASRTVLVTMRCQILSVAVSKGVTVRTVILSLLKKNRLAVLLVILLLGR